MDDYVAKFLMIALVVVLGISCFVGDKDNTVKSSVTKLLNQTSTYVTDLSDKV